MAIRNERENPLSGDDFKPYTSEQWFYLIRFADILVQRANLSGKMDSSDWRWKLVNISSFTTWRICSELGLKNEVEQVMDRIRNSGNNSVNF